MAKQKEENVVKEEVKSTPVKTETERKIMMDDFILDYPSTKGYSNSLSHGFKVWWTLIEKRNENERKVFSEWEKEFNRFLEYRPK